MSGATRQWSGLEVAVIGMNGRFPGALNLNEFWENLQKGVESISFFTEEELTARGAARSMVGNPDFVKAKGLMDRVEFFDPFFFNFTPAEAEVMDPQLRIFYEGVWEVLETAGYNPGTYDGAIGLYAGASNNRWWEMKAFLSEKAELLGGFALDHLIDRDFLSTRLAHRLNLKGPAITVKTACSTALVAVDLACRGLLTGQCDIAVAGGVSYIYLRELGYLYKEGMIKSPDGHCRAFAENARGVVFSDGMGVVALKRLQDAIEHRDTIWAVIKGLAVNNDGGRKGTYESPCVEGQLEVIRMAHHLAEVEPETIGYIEAHGTGTVIGDPIEIESLRQAFDTGKEHFCAVGSVKTNLGHTDTAAGITGFIKAVLALRHRLIPPSIHFERPNPKINFQHSPFYVNSQLSPWQPGVYPWLRAGVSSFGVGGTNVHVVLEEAPEPLPGSESRPWHMIMLSARTEPALQRATANLAAYLEENSGLHLADVAYTLQVGRKAFRCRKVLVTSTAADASRLLGACADPASPGFGSVPTALARETNPLVFMFSGQGAQYVNMGLDLYRTQRVFREETDRCFEILNPLLGCDLKTILYPGSLSDRSDTSDQSDQSDSSDRSDLSGTSGINRTELAQPLLFVLEYAMAKLLVHWGLGPYAMIGHSIGEYAAACLSGVFSLEDALKVVAARGKLMQQMPPGAMLSVTLAEAELVPLLAPHPQLALAAVNAPTLCVVSGPRPAVEAFEAECKTRGYECRRLHTSHAFHSAMMDPILGPFKEVLGQIRLNKPSLPYISNLTGRWITLEEAVSPAYWVNHLRSPVRYYQGLGELFKGPQAIFIELGPGQGLATFARKHPGKKPGHIILNLVKHPRESVPDDRFLLSAIGQLWLQGVEIDGEKYWEDEQRQRIPLPTYSFDHQRFWIDESGQRPGLGIAARASARVKKPDIEDWFYAPSWKRSMAPLVPLVPVLPVQGPGKDPLLSHWLFFMDEGGFGELVAERLKDLDAGNRITTVRKGTSFTGAGNGEYTVNPGQAGDYESLMSQLAAQGKTPRRIVHLWSVAPVKTREAEAQWDETVETHGFYSLLYLARALAKGGHDADIDLKVLSNHMQEVTGHDLLSPQKATILGPVMVIPREYPNIRCSSIDFLPAEPGGEGEKGLVEQLTAELLSEDPGSAIAYRGPYRWVQTVEPVPLKKPGPKIPRLKEGGIYLVTGGLGGIGLAIARHLARGVKARLILTGRSALPPKEQWPERLAAAGAQDSTSRKIRQVLELEETGAQVLVGCADVADIDRMQAVVAEAEKQWGAIDGVIHAAGLPGGGLIQLKTRELAGAVLAPKVKGTLVLNEIFKHHALDFFILCSSINAVIPLLGQVDYYAANAFMDAFAYYKTSTSGVFTVSINWDTWQEVGMAVEAAKRLIAPGAEGPGESPGRETDHPLFHRLITETADQDIYVTVFRLDQHWVLDEHKIAESGKGLAPGVTYLEMARAAFERYQGNHRLEIRDAFFFNPLVVGEGEEAEVRFILKKPAPAGSAAQAAGYDFQVQSRTGQGEEGWQTHALGKIFAVEKAAEPVIHDISQLEAACRQKEIDPRGDQTGGYTRRGLLIFGPRWQNLRRLHLGEDRGLACLQLGESFAGEVGVFKLHPALLDSATGFLFGHVGQGAYIPFSYRRLTLNGPLPARIFSYARLLQDQGQDSAQDSLKFDIVIMDEQGVELADIQEFTMLRVSAEVKSKIETSPAALKPEPREATLTVRQKEFLKNGLLTSEGIEVFDRILGSPLPQVVVSTVDLAARREESGNAAALLGKSGPEDNKAAGPVVFQPRPALSTTYVAPQTDSEKTIARAWQELLGIEQVGVHDNFFDLGGDSLNIVQLNTRLKKVLKRDIPVAAMFNYLTVDSFARYLDPREQERSAAEEIDRGDELEKSKKRMRARTRKPLPDEVVE